MLLGVGEWHILNHCQLIFIHRKIYFHLLFVDKVLVISYLFCHLIISYFVFSILFDLVHHQIFYIILVMNEKQRYHPSLPIVRKLRHRHLQPLYSYIVWHPIIQFQNQWVMQRFEKLHFRLCQNIFKNYHFVCFLDKFCYHTTGPRVVDIAFNLSILEALLTVLELWSSS